MRYISTRDNEISRDFDAVLLEGLAPDGGLYVPESLPVFGEKDLKSLANLSYQDLALEILRPFMANSRIFDDKLMASIIKESYHDFRHQAIAPLR